MRGLLHDNEALRRVPAIRRAAMREAVAVATAVGLLVVVSILLFASVVGFRATDGAAAPPLQTAALAAVALGPFAVTAALLWWGRRARARRAVEEVTLAGWPKDQARWYRRSRALRTWRSRAFVVFVAGLALVFAGALTGSHLHAPLGLTALSRLGLWPWRLGIVVFPVGLVASVGLATIAVLVTVLPWPGRPPVERPATTEFLIPLPRRQRRWARSPEDQPSGEGQSP